MRNTARRIAVAAGAVAIAGGAWCMPVVASAATTPPTGTVTVNDLNVRRAPTTHSASIVTVDRGFSFAVRCRVAGPSVGGNTTWLAVGPDVGKWVSANYVTVRGSVPVCGAGSTVRATTTGQPVLNSFAGPAIADGSVEEYQPGSHVRVRCTASNRKSSGDKAWYLTKDGPWLTAAYVTLPRGTELPIC